MSTFADIYNEVKLGTGNRSDIIDNIKQAVNEATLDMLLMFRIRHFIESTTITTSSTAGVATYALDETVYDILTVRDDDNDVPLTPGDTLEYDSIPRSSSSDYGTPTKWLIDGRNLVLYNNVPDDSEFSITYRYLRRLTPMSTDSDTFPLPFEWERPTKLLAKSYVFELLGQNEKALAAYQQAMAVASTRKPDKYWRDMGNKAATVNASSPVGDGEWGY
jgi:hypothetical protein